LRGTEQEYLLEFHRIGNSVKVTAIDPVTGREAAIVGPANAGKAYLSRTAVRKLQYVMNRDKDDKPLPGILV
jgi:hypothetical protein